MKSLKTRLLSAFGAAAIVLSASQAAQASWLSPSVADIEFSLEHITAEVTQLVAMACVKAENVKVVYVEDVVSAEELADIKADLKDFNTQLEIISLKNTLNNLKVLEGSNITAFKDFLNSNDIDVSDVIGVEVFRDGRVMILGCAEGCK
jgi:SUMO ligase MMS21 Smc5/6 complex component